MSSILKIKDSVSGEWIDVPAIVGPKGEPGNSGVYFGETEPTDENVNVWIRETDNSDNALSFISYTPQKLTEEQKAQARENIGLDDLPSGEETGADMDVEWKNVLDFTVEEEVSSIRLEITDIIQKLNNASDILIRFVAERVSSADVIGESPKGTISLGTAAYAPAILADKQIVPYNIYESNASGGYRVVTTIRIRNNRDWKTMEYRITPANHNHTTVYNQGINLVYVENNNHYITVKATNSMIGINSKLNIYTLSAVKRSD